MCPRRCQHDLPGMPVGNSLFDGQASYLAIDQSWRLLSVTRAGTCDHDQADGASGVCLQFHPFHDRPEAWCLNGSGGHNCVISRRHVRKREFAIGLDHRPLYLERVEVNDEEPCLRHGRAGCIYDLALQQGLAELRVAGCEEEQYQEQTQKKTNRRHRRLHVCIGRWKRRALRLRSGQAFSPAKRLTV